jgi:hypothetical protein
MRFFGGLQKGEMLETDENRGCLAEFFRFTLFLRTLYTHANSIENQLNCTVKIAGNCTVEPHPASYL